MTAEEEKQLAIRVVNENDFLARERLVRSNLRLVVSIAKKYGNRQLTLGDLIEEGNLGLIKAVDYYDPHRGVRFSTYAAWWIKQSIKHALLSNVRPVHIPTYMVSLINQWRHLASEMKARIGRRPTVEEMAELMKLPKKKAMAISKVTQLINTTKEIFSTGSDDDDEQSLEATLEDVGYGRPEDSLVNFEQQQKVVKMLDKLDDREATIMKMCYGIGGEKTYSLQEIAEHLGLTRERIRQLQKATLARLCELMIV